MWLLTDESSGKRGHFPSSRLVDVHLSSSVFLLSVLGHIPMCPISYKGFSNCRMEEEAVVGRFIAPLGVPGRLHPARWECGVWHSGNSLGAVGFFLCFSALLGWQSLLPPKSGGCEEGVGSLLLLCRKPQQPHEGDSQIGSPQRGFLSCSI